MSTFFFATNAGTNSSHAYTIYRLITEISTADRSRRFMPLYKIHSDDTEVLQSLLRVLSDISIFHFDGYPVPLAHLLGHSHTVGVNSLPQILAALPQPILIFLNHCAEPASIADFKAAGLPIVIGTPGTISNTQATEFASSFYREFLFANRTLADAYTMAFAAAGISPVPDGNFGRYSRWRSEEFFTRRQASSPQRAPATAGAGQPTGMSLPASLQHAWQALRREIQRYWQYINKPSSLSNKPIYSPLSAQFVVSLLTFLFVIWIFYRVTLGSTASTVIPTNETVIPSSTPTPTAITAMLQLQPAAEQLAPIRDGEIIEGVAFGHASNSLFATGIEHSIYQWRLPTGELLPTLDVDTSSVNHIAIDRASSLLAYSGRDGAVGMISLDYQWHRKLEPHAGAIAALHISHHGRALFTSSMDGVLMQHDLISGEGRLLRSEPGAPIGAIVTDATDELLAFATNQSIQIWRWATREPLYQLVGHQGPIHWLDFSPDGRYLLSAGSDQLIYLWDIAGQRIVHQFTDATSPVNVVRYFPDGALFIAAGDDGMIRIWDAQSYQKIDEVEGLPGGVAALVINHNGSQIAAAGRNGVIKLWNVVPRHEER